MLMLHASAPFRRSMRKGASSEEEEEEEEEAKTFSVLALILFVRVLKGVESCAVKFYDDRAE